MAFCRQDCPESQLSYDEIIAERCGDLGIPVMTGARFGHEGAQFTLPLGASVEMNADAGSLRLPTSAVALND